MDAIVAGWVRTPFHRAHKGALAGVRPDTMVAECIKEVVKRLGLDPAEVDDVIDEMMIAICNSNCIRLYWRMR